MDASNEQSCSYEFADEYLLISGIKHFKFCRRRWALIHIEQQWEENALTTSGHLMHEAVHDSNFTEKRGRLLLSRGMPVRSNRLKISGVCDMVELIKNDNGVTISNREGKYRVYPVEYKRGKPDDADIWHLCAQVMCLEEMFVTDISEGAVYYGELRRRQIYEITNELRTEVTSAVNEMNVLMRRGYTPKVKPQKACRNCSLKEICMPGLNKQISAAEYVKKALEDI
jgi:CRISPR-associated exonuclease Cas4